MVRIWRDLKAKAGKGPVCCVEIEKMGQQTTAQGCCGQGAACCLGPQTGVSLSEVGMLSVLESGPTGLSSGL